MALSTVFTGTHHLQSIGFKLSQHSQSEKQRRAGRSPHSSIDDLIFGGVLPLEFSTLPCLVGPGAHLPSDSRNDNCTTWTSSFRAT